MIWLQDYVWDKCTAQLVMPCQNKGLKLKSDLSGEPGQYDVLKLELILMA